ncbi:MAG TPA: PKD domain-containing protein, partial [Bacteroidia bacterium]|nr:PKD domain-containing protein [Bacteroidia bacterium]
SINSLCPGTYSLVITDRNGCTTDTTGLLVTQPTAITITKNVIINSHCGQTDGSCSITVGGGTPGIGGYSYLWSNNSTSQNLSNAVPGVYCVTVTDGNKCTDSACVTINDVASPVVIITAFTNNKCNGDSSGTATATATGGSAPYTYSWSTNPIQTNSVATGLKAGSYTITVTDSGGCVSTAVATITQPALVVTSTTLPPTICIGQSATINATSVGGTPPYTYTWSTGATGSSITVSPLVTTTYTVTSTLDSNNCQGGPVTVVVTVDPPLTIKVTATPDTVCLGNTATLTATGSGGDGNYTYSWQPGNLTGSPVIVTPLANTVYTVTLSDGCTTPNVVDSISVIIDPSPIVKFTADTLSGCYPLCVTFINQSTVAGGAITSEEWSFGNGVKSNKDTANYCYGTAGVFSVGLTVTTNIGCPDSVTKPNYITVYGHPTAAFTMSPAQVTTLDPTIYFTNESTDIYGIKKYFWQFDDLPFDITDTAKNPSHTYHDSGRFCPELWVTNIHGCVDSVTECVDITPYFTFFIPNAFSPNGDGKNDVFAPKGDYVCSFQMYIFDRWGMMLYYTEDMNHGWDGT